MAKSSFHSGLITLNRIVIEQACLYVNIPKISVMSKCINVFSCDFLSEKYKPSKRMNTDFLCFICISVCSITQHKFTKSQNRVCV